MAQVDVRLGSPICQGLVICALDKRRPLTHDDEVVSSGEIAEDNVHVPPEAALRPGRLDPILVLLLWAGRRSFVPLLLIGMIGGWLTGQLQQDSLASLEQPADLIAALLSPLAGIALAVVVRLLVGWLALAAAWPLSRWQPGERRRDWRLRWQDAVDRWRLAQAYRSLRWTWRVRQVAIERGGVTGRRIALAVPALTVAAVVLVVVLILLIAARPGPGAAPLPVMEG